MLLTFLLIILLILLVPTVYASVVGAPLAITSKSQLKKIIHEAEIKPKDKFYELGAGTGRVMIAVAKMSGAKVVGFELSPIFYLIALLNLKIHNIKNYELYCKNFFNTDLKQADIVFCFLMPKALKKLKQKFERELQPNTKIISFYFQIPDLIPYKTIETHNQPPVFFYKI